MLRGLFSVVAALVVVGMLYGATGSWEACAGFLVLIAGFIVYQLRSAKKAAVHVCRGCGETLDRNARECRSCGSASWEVREQ